MPQLKDKDAEREWPAITTHNHDNHGIRSENWRYIQYADGSEELYDMKNDPHEWTNVASKEEYSAIKAKLKKYVPKVNKKPAPGSRARILTYDGKTAIWQGKEIKKDEAIPGL